MLLGHVMIVEMSELGSVHNREKMYGPQHIALHLTWST